jgi:hypothetical protein
VEGRPTVGIQALMETEIKPHVWAGLASVFSFRKVDLHSSIKTYFKTGLVLRFSSFSEGYFHS